MPDLADIAPTLSDLAPSGSATDAAAEQALKNLAKNLARAAAADIEDRHIRAQVRTRCYNQTLTLLRQFEKQRQGELVGRRRIVRLAGSAIALLGAALAAALLV